jgi:hypothetical protein
MTPEPQKNPNPSPRALFMQDKNSVDAHRRLVNSALFTNSKEVALAEFTRAVCALASTQDLSAGGATQAQAASFQMICGAYNFIEVFMRLGEPYAAPAAKDKIQSLTEN